MRKASKTPKRTPSSRLRWRQQRLALIATLVLGGNHVAPVLMAETPSTPWITHRSLPPLPVSHSEHHSVVRQNPFVPPAAEASDPEIRLASGDPQPAIRLRPTSAPIGLNTIGEEPITLRPSSISIDPVSSSPVQSNPLIGSQHHDNRNLVGAEAAELAGANGVHSFVPIPATGPSLNEPSVRQATDAREDRAPIAESQPIYFSISDKSNDSASADLTEDADEKVVSAAPILLAETPVIIPAIEPHFEESGSRVEEIAINEPLEGPEFEDGSLETGQTPRAVPQPDPVVAPMTTPTINAITIDEPVPPIQFEAELDAIPMQPAPPPASLGATFDSTPQEAVVAAPVTMPAPSLNQRRFRPPVAVGSPPIAVVRSGATSGTVGSMPAVQPVTAPLLVQDDHLLEVPQPTVTPLPPLDSEVRPAALYLSRTQVRSLTIDGHVRRVAIGDKNICQAFSTGPNQLKLIGTGNGVTRLVVWADSSDSTPTRVQSFDIHVNDAGLGTDKSGNDQTAVLTESIRRMFPTSRIQVQHFPDRVVVNGYCDSEESAKQIVRMVRKTCLIPVRDEIQVR